MTKLRINRAEQVAQKAWATRTDQALHKTGNGIEKSLQKPTTHMHTAIGIVSFLSLSPAAATVVIDSFEAP